MGTIENDFVKKLEAFLDTEFSPTCHKRINALLSEYRKNLPPVYIKSNPKIEYRDIGIAKPIKVDNNVVIDDIVKEGCNFFGVEEKLLLSKSRKNYLVEKRHMIASYLFNVKKCTLMGIGEKFNRDHTTIINSNVTVRDLCDSNPLFKEQYINLITHLNNNIPCPIN